MIRTFLEFFLSRSLDDGTPTTGWFHRLLLRNDQLNRFDAEARQLDMRLRSSAAKHRRSLASLSEDVNLLTLSPQRQAFSTSVRVKNSGHSLSWLAGIATAAILLLIFSPNWLRPTPPAAHAGEFSQQLTAVPGEVLRLINRAAQTSQTQLPQLSPLANLTLPVLPTWDDVAIHVESPVRQEIDIWQESWQKFQTSLQESPREL